MMNTKRCTRLMDVDDKVTMEWCSMLSESTQMANVVKGCILLKR